MAWVIEDSTTTDARHVAKLGKDEFERRKEIAKAKVEDLTDWKEQQFMAVQFESLAMQCDTLQFGLLEKLGGAKWAKLIYRMASK